MKNSHILILGTLFITQTVLAGVNDRKRFDDPSNSKIRHSQTNHGTGNGPGLGAGGVNVDPKDEYILKFKDAVAAKYWDKAAEYQNILWTKFGYKVSFTKDEIDPKQEYITKFNEAVKSEDWIAAAELQQILLDKFDYKVTFVDPKQDYITKFKEALATYSWDKAAEYQKILLEKYDYKVTFNDPRSYINSFNEAVAAKSWDKAAEYQKILLEKFDYKVSFNDPRNYINLFNEAVAAKSWDKATEYQKILADKYGVKVSFVRELSSEDYAVIKDYQYKYDQTYFSNKLAAADLYNYIYKTYGKELVPPSRITGDALQLEAVKIESGTSRIISSETMLKAK